MTPKLLCQGGIFTSDKTINVTLVLKAVIPVKDAKITLDISEMSTFCEVTATLYWPGFILLYLLHLRVL